MERRPQTHNTQTMSLLLRLVLVTSLLSLVRPAVFDIIPSRRLPSNQVKQEKEISLPLSPCHHYRRNRHQTAKCREKIKRKRLRQCFKSWLRKSEGRHGNSLLSCLYVRQR